MCRNFIPLEQKPQLLVPISRIIVRSAQIAEGEPTLAPEHDRVELQAFAFVTLGVFDAYCFVQDCGVHLFQTSFGVMGLIN